MTGLTAIEVFEAAAKDLERVAREEISEGYRKLTDAEAQAAILVLVRQIEPLAMRVEQLEHDVKCLSTAFWIDGKQPEPVEAEKICYGSLTRDEAVQIAGDERTAAVGFAVVG